MNSVNITGVILQNSKSSNRQLEQNTNQYYMNQQQDESNDRFPASRSPVNSSKWSKHSQYPSSAIANRTRSPLVKQQNPFTQSSFVLNNSSNSKVPTQIASQSRLPLSHQRIKSEISQVDRSSSFLLEDSNLNNKSMNQQIKISKYINDNKASKSPRQKSSSFIQKDGGNLKSNNQLSGGLGEGISGSGNNNNISNISVYNMVLNDEVSKNKSFFQQIKGSKNPSQPQFQLPSTSQQNLHQYLNNSPHSKSNRDGNQNSPFSGGNSKQTFEESLILSRGKNSYKSKQGNNFSNQTNNNNTQNTHLSTESKCSNCIEVEKELEMIRQTIKSCSKCSQSCFSNSRPNSGASQIPDNSILEQQQQQMQQQYQQQFMQEKVVSMRLQEQVQQLRRQLDQMTLERDQLKYTKNSESTDLQEKLIKQDGIVKALQASHIRLEKKVNEYSSLKTKLSELLDCLKKQQQEGNAGGGDILNQQLLIESDFLKSYLCSTQDQFNAIHQKSLSLSTTVNSQPTLKINSLELANKQLAFQEREEAMSKYQNLPSTIKVLSLAQKINSSQSNNK